MYEKDSIALVNIDLFYSLSTTLNKIVNLSLSNGIFFYVSFFVFFDIMNHL